MDGSFTLVQQYYTRNCKEVQMLSLNLKQSLCGCVCMNIYVYMYICMYVCLYVYMYMCEYVLSVAKLDPEVSCSSSVVVCFTPSCQ
jgi:hypothetical protein